MSKKYYFEGVIGALLFIALLVVVMVQVLGRTPLFVGPVWTEELARWLWVWMALIGVGAVERKRSHLRMGLLTATLPKGFQRWLNTAIDLVYLGISCHLVLIAWKSVLRTWNNEAVSLPVSDAVLYASAFVAFIFITGRIVQRLWMRFRGVDIDDLEGTE